MTNQNQSSEGSNTIFLLILLSTCGGSNFIGLLKQQILLQLRKRQRRWFSLSTSMQTCTMAQLSWQRNLACNPKRPSFLFANGLHKNLEEHSLFGKFASWEWKLEPIIAMSWKDRKLFNLKQSVTTMNIWDTLTTSTHCYLKQLQNIETSFGEERTFSQWYASHW